MSLILPPGVAPPPPPEGSPLPLEFVASMDLLMEGIKLGSIVVLTKTLDDGDGGQKVYDLGVVLPHPMSAHHHLTFAIGRLYPQELKDNAAAPAPETAV